MESKLFFPLEYVRQKGRILAEVCLVSAEATYSKKSAGS